MNFLYKISYNSFIHNLFIKYLYMFGTIMLYILD